MRLGRFQLDHGPSSPGSTCGNIAPVCKHQVFPPAKMLVRKRSSWMDVEKIIMDGSNGEYNADFNDEYIHEFIDI